MGRPRLDPEHRMEWTHSVNFLKPDYYAVSRHAEKRGVALARFLREAAIEKMEREKEVLA